MAEQGLLFIDIEPKLSGSAPTERTLWTRSDNPFKFNFLPDNAPSLQENPSPDRAEPAPSQVSFTGEGSAFAFDFQIPAVTPVEDMETEETPDAGSAGSQGGIQEEKPSSLQEVNTQSELQTKTKKKKKKSGPKKVVESTQAQQKPAEGSQGGEDTELSAEEQLNRQLDWCIEQLEVGMRSTKGTPKQKEETSRALKTLRSSKAPLAKKRQVMRAMNGEYRKKMDEEKNKQFKLIQSEIASAQVKVVADSPKTSVFRQRAKDKTQTPTTEDGPQQAEAQDTDRTAKTREETAVFVFTPSKEEFRFDFL
ncbi:UPF0488 protein C8orf33 homolog [Limanda limanda]|uniref:UPF0488 protein C8orf33 homolog n=1 Tax=Limanda limanda TaxID=27771 RepID=UPI0029C89018|nr:UPF0488 protein C8orf33 homolog [Limanda limanda]